MERIQRACVRLIDHYDSSVRKVIEEIAAADREREQDVVRLKAKLHTAEIQIKTLNAAIKRKDAQIKELQRMQFGQSAEKGFSSPGQAPEGDLGAIAEEPEHVTTSVSGSVAATTSQERKPRGLRGRQKAPRADHLRREVVQIEPDKAQFCSCGCRSVRIGEQVVEKFAFKPAEVYVIEERYPKYTCRNCDRFVQAKVPERAFDYSKFDDSMTVGVLVAKYGDFLPLFRQEEILGRSGVQIGRSTLWRLVERAGDVLKPIHNALVADLKSSSKLFMDETTFPLLVPGNGKTKTAYAWAMCRDDRRWRGNQPPAVAFRFATSRAGLHAEQFLDGFSGILQVDGYAGYNRLTSNDRPGGPLELAYCWAHARRKFFNAWKSAGSLDAGDVVGEIDFLFANEREIWGQLPQVRLLERKRLSEPILDALFPKLQTLSQQCMANSPLGEAISYTMKLRHGLGVFLTDGRVEMDNNQVENTIRPLALLRKNALFAGSEFGGEMMAVVSSLIATCKMNGVEPHAYFTWVFDKVAKKLPLAEYQTLLPWNCPPVRAPAVTSG